MFINAFFRRPLARKIEGTYFKKVPETEWTQTPFSAATALWKIKNTKKLFEMKFGSSWYMHELDLLPK